MLRTQEGKRSRRGGRELEETKDMLNTTTIFGMVIVSIETGIKTMNLHYRPEWWRTGITGITFRTDDRDETMLFKKSYDIFSPVSAVSIEP